MKSAAVFILLMLSLYLCNAQTPYQGGNGDGYDKAAILIQTVGVEVEQSRTLKIFPSLLQAGEKLTIEFDEAIAELKLIDINGREFKLENQPRQILPSDLSSGVYFLRLRSSKNPSYTAKLVVIDP